MTDKDSAAMVDHSLLRVLHRQLRLGAVLACIWIPTFVERINHSANNDRIIPDRLSHDMSGHLKKFAISITTTISVYAALFVSVFACW